MSVKIRADSWPILRNSGLQVSRRGESVRYAMIEGDELVAHSVNRSDEKGAVGIVFDLLAQPRDAVIDSAIAGALSFRPGRADQFLARNNDTWTRDEELQHLELSQGERHNLVGAAEFHGLEIETKISKVRHLNGWQ